MDVLETDLPCKLTSVSFPFQGRSVSKEVMITVHSCPLFRTVSEEGITFKSLHIMKMKWNPPRKRVSIPLPRGSLDAD